MNLTINFDVPSENLLNVIKIAMKHGVVSNNDMILMAIYHDSYSDLVKEIVNICYQVMSKDQFVELIFAAEKYWREG